MADSVHIIHGVECFSRKDAVASLGIAERTLWVWERSGKIKLLREGKHVYVPVAEVDRVREAKLKGVCDV